MTLSETVSHLGIFCPPLSGHLNPVAVVGRALIAAGHRCTVFHFEEFRGQVEREKLEFVPLGSNSQLASQITEMGKAQDLRSLRLAVEGARQSSENICLRGPDAVRKAGIELILADQNEPAAGALADYLGIPFLSACPSLPLNREPAIPPPFTNWGYSHSLWALLRNQAGLAAADFLISPINRTLNQYRRKWHLPKVRKPDDTFSRLAQISQTTKEFDFPRHSLPETFHPLGPWLDEEAQDKTGFPFERLDGRPMVYASFGTLQPNAYGQFQMIAAACASHGLQMVLAAGAAAKDQMEFPGIRLWWLMRPNSP